MPLKALARRALKVAARSPAFAGLVERVPGADALYREPWERRHPFDRAHGVDTSGLVPPEKLGFATAEQSQARAYGGSQPSILRAALRLMPPIDGATFVDLGCGKGRPLIVASEFPFREAIGVEYSADLVDIARANARVISGRHPERPPIRVAQGDAGAFQMPDGDLVVFLYNPFGAEIVARVVARLEESLTRSARAAYVIYYNPVHGRLFDDCAALKRRFAGELAYAQEELGFGPDTFDPLVIWQGGTAPAPVATPHPLRIIAENEFRAVLRAA